MVSKNDVARRARIEAGTNLPADKFIQHRTPLSAFWTRLPDLARGGGPL